MATTSAIANGHWEAAGTWSTSIPGTGDTADLFGKKVTVLDTRRIKVIRFGAANSELILQSSLGAPVIQFDDAAGAGIELVAFQNCYIRGNGTASTAAKMQSFTSNPTNRWASGGNNLNLHYSLVRSTFADFVYLIPGDESAWTDEANLSEFRENGGTNGVFYPRNKGRYRSCKFVRCDVSMINPGPYTSALSSCTWSGASTFITTANGGSVLVISKNHGAVANDYRMAAGNTSSPGLSSLTAGDQPASTDNVRLYAPVGNPIYNWDMSSTIATFATDANTTLLMPAGIELVVRGDYQTQASPPFFSLATSARIIQHAYAEIGQLGTRWSLRAGPMARVSNLVETFSSAMFVNVRGGTLRFDVGGQVGRTWVNPGARIMIDAGVTVTVKGASTFTVPVGNIVFNGTSGSRSRMRSSKTGTAWILDLRRGFLIATDGIPNYTIQNIQHPAMDFWSPTNKSRLVYMNSATAKGRWSIMQYNHNLLTWSTSIQFDTTSSAGGDGHRFPSVIHDTLGIVHIVYGAHQEPFLHARANSSDSITSWTLATNLMVHPGTYPNLARSGATFALWYRRASRFGWFRLSTNNLNSWTSIGTTLVNSTVSSLNYDLTYPFGVSFGTGTAPIIHLFGSFRNFSNATDGVSQVNKDPWYIKSLDGGTTWKSANGTTLSIPIGPGAIGVVTRISGAGESSGSIDSQGNPHIFYIKEQTNANRALGQENVLFHGYHNGSSWATFRVSGSGQYPNGSCRSAWDSGLSGIRAIWDASSATYNASTGSTLGDVTLRLSKWTTGSTMTNETVYVDRAIRTIPLYPHMLPLSRTEGNELHLFWSGNDTPPGGLEWENYGKTVKYAYVDVKDSDASPSVISPFASLGSLDSGNNTNWIFEATTSGVPYQAIIESNQRKVMPQSRLALREVFPT